MAKGEDLTVEWRQFDDIPAPLLYELLRFRQAIFVVEQKSPYEDLDTRDHGASHLLLRIDGQLAGYLRVIPEKGLIRIGRVAVAPAHRGRGLARKMMEAAFARHPDTAVAISAQTYLAPFYTSLGFTPTSPEYDDTGVPHIDMVRPGS
ncbi:MAG TPA: GNAT family N-acetyltransferase [Stellaceae bacterium]|nr:GNAT family N-acetyltransferase [Stellaceae bacterium]